MSNAATTVLVVEGDAVDAGLIQAALASATSLPFRVEWVAGLAFAPARPGGGGIGVILLDPPLPAEGFARLIAAAERRS